LAETIETLDDVLRQERRAELPPRTIDEAAALLEPIARALAAEHVRGGCHRGVMPACVVVSGVPRSDACAAKLLGLERASRFARTEGPQAAGVAGAYHAPEQRSEAYGVVGPWTDVFALALLLVELVIGRPALGDGPAEQLASASTDPVCRPTPRARGVAVTDA